MIEFKVEEGDDPKKILLDALPPLQNLTINSIEQIEDEFLSLESPSNYAN